MNETNKYDDYINKIKDKLNNIEINEEDFNRKKKSTYK